MISHSPSLYPTFLSLTLLGVFCGRAELPPQVYDQLKDESAESVAIETLSVSEEVSSDTEGVKILTISVKAKILSVERSKSGLKPGDHIQVRYQVMQNAEMKVGPSEPIIVEIGKPYLAYLEKVDSTGTYRITARGRSFCPLRSAEAGK